MADNTAHRETPLMEAKTPNMDSLAFKGRSGTLVTIPEGFVPGSEVGILTVLGYLPGDICKGRAALEARGLGMSMRNNDVAYRCNLMSISPSGRVSMKPEGLHMESAYQLMDMVLNCLCKDGRYAYGSIDALRHVVVADCVPDEYVMKVSPYDISSPVPDSYIHLSAIMNKHPLNVSRLARGLDPVNCAWVWSPGDAVDLPRLRVDGAMIGAVPLVRGIGVSVGLDVLTVEGADGTVHTDYSAKAQAMLEALERYDFVFVHVEACDEASHSLDRRAKIEAIESIDRHLIRPLVDLIDEGASNLRAAVIPDHITDSMSGSHESGPVPFVLCGSGIEADEVERYDELSAMRGSEAGLRGREFFEAFLR